MATTTPSNPPRNMKTLASQALKLSAERQKNSPKSLLQSAGVTGPGAEGAAPYARAEMAQEPIVTDSLLGRSIKVGRFYIRPFTLSSIALLKEINSPIIMGKTVDEMPNILLDVLTMILFQTIPLEEAVELSENPKATKLRALAFGETVAANEVEPLIAAAMSELKKATSGQVMAEPPPVKGKKKEKGGTVGNDSSRPI